MVHSRRVGVPFSSAALAFAVALSFQVHAAAAEDGVADLLLLGGRVFTADPERPWAEAIAIRGDRITAVGTSSDLRAMAAPGTRVIDVEGRLVVPGVNDAHAHLAPRPPGVELAELSDDPTWEEVLASVRRAAGSQSADLWIYGTIGGAVLDDPRVDRAAIDAIAPERPVLLTCWSGHGVIANSVALQRLGIGEEEPDPPGGFYVRRPGTRVLTGLAHEYAGFAILRGAPIERESIVAAVAALDEEARGLGITTLQMMAMGDWARDPTTILVAAGARVRWRFIDFPTVAPGDWSPDPSRPRTEGLIAHSGTKWVLDGTPVERLMAVHEAFADRPGSVGALNFAEASLRTGMVRALSADEPLLLHAVGDAAIDAVFDAMDATGGAAAWRAQRLRLEHGDLLTRERFERARSLGVVLVQNPSHFTIVEILRARLGPDRAAGVQPVASTLAAGIPLALGSDGPLSPWLNIAFAIAHPANPREALTREAALLAYTRGSAWAEFEESSKGMLRAGMLADLAVLSQDVLTVPADSLPGTTSVVTIVAGQIVHDARADQRIRPDQGSETGP
jgi:predicted amidohydrolase YtcJ